MVQQRDTYYDFLRGIAIIMVIGIHTYSDGLMHINLFLRQFLSCAVPIFLAISALQILSVDCPRKTVSQISSCNGTRRTAGHVHPEVRI